MEAIDIELIPCLGDNFAYLVTCVASGEAAIVDPSDAAPVLRAVDERGAKPVKVLATHHHWDHTAGIEDVLARWPDLDVCGHEEDRGRIPGQTVFFEQGARIALGQVEAEVRHVPGHTLGAVAYHFAVPVRFGERRFPGAVFTGDTLFYAGCGRLFEGTPEMMYASLTAQLADALPPETAVFCGHEYTVSNLRYAAHAEPDNQAVAEQLLWAQDEIAAGRPTVPSTLAIERQVNPFIRAGSVERFAQRRRRKDSFRG